MNSLTHSQTPEELQAINIQIEACLSSVIEEQSKTFDHAHFKVLVDQRAKLVDKLLKVLRPAKLQAFAEEEVKVNQYLTDLTIELRKEAKLALTGLKKSSQAIKQYRQV